MWLFQNQPKNAKLAAKFKSFFGDVRRAGYLFGSVQVWPELLEDLKGPSSKDSLVQWSLKLTADLSDFLYFFCDNLPLFADFGIVPMGKPMREYLYDDLGVKVWVLSSLCWVILGYLDYAKAKRSIRKAESSEERVVREEAARLEGLMLISNLCNLLIGIYFIFPDQPITSPMAGSFGVISALIGIWSKWK